MPSPSLSGSGQPSASWKPSLSSGWSGQRSAAPTMPSPSGSGSGPGSGARSGAVTTAAAGAGGGRRGRLRRSERPADAERDLGGHHRAANARRHHALASIDPQLPAVDHRGDQAAAPVRDRLGAVGHERRSRHHAVGARADHEVGHQIAPPDEPQHGLAAGLEHRREVRHPAVAGARPGERRREPELGLEREPQIAGQRGRREPADPDAEHHRGTGDLVGRKRVAERAALAEPVDADEAARLESRLGARLGARFGARFGARLGARGGRDARGDAGHNGDEHPGTHDSMLPALARAITAGAS